MLIADESGESGEEHFYPATSDSDLDHSMDRPFSKQPITVSVDDVYRPPTELHRVEYNYRIIGVVYMYII